uniref:Uncharacterized protein n=1 Tax=Parastrongyloides trichosuri TaxID=131310 RepID=A0A0N4ZUP4_PARTI
MAEFLETDDNIDVDRILDNKTFTREQFKLFKELFRDSIDIKEDVEYDTNINVFNYVSGSIKKKVINYILKLNKLIKKLSDEKLIDEASNLITKLRETASLEESDGEEIEQDDLALPIYDDTDISLFLGEEIKEKNHKEIVEEALSKYKRKSLEELYNLLNETELFLKNNKTF